MIGFTKKYLLITRGINEVTCMICYLRFAVLLSFFGLSALADDQMKTLATCPLTKGQVDDYRSYYARDYVLMVEAGHSAVEKFFATLLRNEDPKVDHSKPGKPHVVNGMGVERWASAHWRDHDGDDLGAAIAYNSHVLTTGKGGIVGQDFYLMVSPDGSAKVRADFINNGKILEIICDLKDAVHPKDDALSSGSEPVTVTIPLTTK